MAFYSGFFNSKGLDRTYTAEDFTSYLSSLICNGIQDNYGDCFAITANEDLTVTIGSGKAWINGHYFINDSVYTLDLSRYVDESLSKYLIIGIYCDTNDSVRKCDMEVKAGTAATSPIIPAFSNSKTRTYLTLASIYLRAGTTEIKQSNISDYRENASKCGYVKCILGKCKVSEMLAELVQIRKDLSGLKDGSLSDAVKELQHLAFNTADRVVFTKDEDGRLYYQDSDGNNITGEIKIDGIPYLFAANGVLKTDWRTVFGKRYYYDQQTGNIQLGWVEYADKMYYVTLSEGKLVNQHRTIDGKRYWFDSYGVATESNCISYPDADGDGMGDALLQKTYTVDCLSKKRVKNSGIVPQYYVEDDHEAIISKETFLMVQEEMARRARTQLPFGGKKGYSANHAFSQIIFCAGCGDQFRRIHWNNRGKKSVVWRCVTRLKEKEKCRARTVSEETLKAAFLEALNEMLDDSDTYLNRLRENLEAAINSANPMSAEALSARMAELQRELINRTERRENYDDITEEILRLRELQEQKGMDDATQKEHTKRIKELQKFIQSQPSEITEFDESLVKKLLEKVTVHDEYLEFRFKSGVTISIEM